MKGERTMKANIENIREGAKVQSNRKENAFCKQYSVYALDQLDCYDKPNELVCLRIYGTDARAYACIWVHGRATNQYGYGGGHAGGYGYHRASAAAQEAIKDAGITLSESIDGCGEEAIRKAIEAIAEAAGSSNYFIAEAHA
jgi:hypothetical protein